MVKYRGKEIALAAQKEIDKRKREIQLLLNVVEPDPELQPFLLTDEATFFDAVGDPEQEIRRRLDFYFGQRLPLSLKLPLWQFADEVKRLVVGWPDNWNPPA
jgi:hypothetical protein